MVNHGQKGGNPGKRSGNFSQQPSKKNKGNGGSSVLPVNSAPAGAVDAITLPFGAKFLPLGGTQEAELPAGTKILPGQQGQQLKMMFRDGTSSHFKTKSGTLPSGKWLVMLCAGSMTFPPGVQIEYAGLILPSLLWPLGSFLLPYGEKLLPEPTVVADGGKTTKLVLLPGQMTLPAANGDLVLHLANVLQGEIVLPAPMNLNEKIVLPTDITIPAGASITLPATLTSLPAGFTVPENEMSTDTSPIVFGPGGRVATFANLPKGSRLSENFVLPRGVTLPAETTLPSGTILPAGVVLAAGTRIPSGAMFPEGVDIKKFLP